jgi:chromosome segregation ATPase
MKSFLQSLLIFFSISLCILIAFQWDRETRLQSDMQKQAGSIHDRLEEIQNLNHKLRTTEEEVNRLFADKTALTDEIKSNKVELHGLKIEARTATNTINYQLRQIEAFSNAVVAANDNIREANKQNASLNERVASASVERNDAVVQRNQMVTRLNNIIGKLNGLGGDWDAVMKTLVSPSSNTVVQANRMNQDWNDLAKMLASTNSPTNTDSAGAAK